MKLFIYPRKQGLQDSFLLNLFISEHTEYGPLFQSIPTAPFKGSVSFTENIEQADYVIIPHTYNALVKKYQEYLRESERFANKHKVKTIIFAYGDSHENIYFKNSIILRTAKYKSALKSNEIIIPPFVEDLGQKYGFEPTEKKGKPVVGFSGMVRMPTTSTQLKYQIRMMLSFLGEVLNMREKYERQGLYFRQKSIAVLERDSSIELDLNKRKSFSAAEKTIEGDPQIIRQEFVESIKNSHLPLVVRGHGNYSLRFFEVLSLGRVPLFIDTDTPLPLEKEIDYDKFILRVDYQDLPNLPKIISDFWSRTTSEEFIYMQKLARDTFETKLRSDVFYKKLFENDFKSR